jgi:hypothetical protein
MFTRKMAHTTTAESTTTVVIKVIICALSIIRDMVR